LLADLLALERRFGRQRRERWGPRSLDLDLLWWGDLRLSTPELTLPHPRMLERSFVLVPLAALLSAADQPPQRLPGREGWWE
jgi:2-amino-4-hydroxy-6-hydroxymethyldihydropteridine diphosphokinase